MNLRKESATGTLLDQRHPLLHSKSYFTPIGKCSCHASPKKPLFTIQQMETQTTTEHSAEIVWSPLAMDTSNPSSCINDQGTPRKKSP